MEDNPRTVRCCYKLSDQFHRLDGPAIIYSDGTVEYWIFGKKLDTQSVKQWMIENKIKDLFFNEHEQLAFKLKWS